MIMSRPWTLPLLLLLIAHLHCAKDSTTAQPRSTEDGSKAALHVPLCTLVANPSGYDGKRVAVEGCVTTDGREYIALSDLTNPCDHGGMVPVDAPTLRAEHRFEAEPGKKVCGTFVGTFRVSTLFYDRVLEVEETSNLRTSALE
jgi:hypothetical protein